MAVCEQWIDDFDVHVGINNIIAKDTSPKITYEPPELARQSITDKLKLQFWPPAKRSSTASVSPRGRTPESSSSGRYIYIGPNRDRLAAGSRESLLTVSSNRHSKHMDSPTIPGYFPSHERAQTALGFSRPSSRARDHSPLGYSSFSDRRTVRQMGNSCNTSRQSPSPHSTGRLTPSGNQPIMAQHQQQPRARLQRKRSPTKAEIEGIPPKVPPKTEPAVPKKDKTSPSHFFGRGVPRNRYIEAVHSTSAPNLSHLRGGSTSNLLLEQERPADQLADLPQFSQRYHDKRPKSLKILGLDATRRPESPAPGESDDVPQGLVIREKPSKKKPRGRAGLENIDIPVGNLPPGYSIQTASMLLTCQEIEELQSQARRRGQRFEVLKYSEVSSLTQEMHTLNKHCKYLRDTHVALRSDRQRLHGRVISYLKSASGVSSFSPEGVLKQEEALLEIDQSIDEWATKLEYAEERRAKIQQKLLEHMVAILNLPQPAPKEPSHSRSISDYTSISEKDSRRSDLESIIIYADAGLHRSNTDKPWI
ncbi:hypothetical protein TMEN_6552 [Trichophyton mentagrophytes]|uniref:Up-regulated during septation protein 1 domain-containing protein n=1 Tax=Trichophyton interdigitale (strain MR816) TaxID=1215338 RepID=A0A059J8D3_TRIIM|nr:hypothetical protein H101_06029 [Trichophyton interdigitale H6]KDB23953.1 hypothetical protein H109_04196 [Trichophyton interdigitale MR816]GBF63888.1 hypothetical protein TMEN_6552 [Trichophyton mentagrophytes]